MHYTNASRMCFPLFLIILFLHALNIHNSSNHLPAHSFSCIWKHGALFKVSMARQRIFTDIEALKIIQEEECEAFKVCRQDTVYLKLCQVNLKVKVFLILTV